MLCKLTAFETHISFPHFPVVLCLIYAQYTQLYTACQEKILNGCESSLPGLNIDIVSLQRYSKCMEDFLYHGSNHIMEKPAYGLGELHNDYGRGFYCTRDQELAKEWACGDDHDGIVNVYSLKIKGLKILHLNESPYCILNWLAVLTRFRSYWERNSISSQAKAWLQEHFFVDPSLYDIVIGYRADDSYFSFARDFVSNSISLRQLSEAMRLGRLGEQVVLISRKAFNRISFHSFFPADASEYYEKRMIRDKLAREEYRKQRAAGLLQDELYMIDIMRRNMSAEEIRAYV